MVRSSVHPSICPSNCPEWTPYPRVLFTFCLDVVLSRLWVAWPSTFPAPDTVLETDQYGRLKRNPFRNSRSQEIDDQESDRLDRNVPLVWIVIGTQWAEHLRRIKGHDQGICSVNTCTLR